MHDYHIHSAYSEDASIPMRDMAQAAIEKGLTGICFTDHIDLDYPSNEIHFEFDYEAYHKEICMLKSEFACNLDICEGVELGLQLHVTELNNKFLTDKYFDFIIGSIHSVTKKELYKQCYLEGITEHQGILNYFAELNGCLNQFNNFDVVGHIDVVRRHISEEKEPLLAHEYREHLHDTLKKVIEMGKGIELNTSGMRYKLSSFHPSKAVLEMYKSLGGEIITLGSDSHKTKDLGYGFGDASELLKDVGFKHYTIFKERKPIFIKL